MGLSGILGQEKDMWEKLDKSEQYISIGLSITAGGPHYSKLLTAEETACGIYLYYNLFFFF